MDDNTLEVGTEVQFKDVVLKVEEVKHWSCSGCYFLAKKCYSHPYKKTMGSCSGVYRSDEKTVVFREITNN